MPVFPPEALTATTGPIAGRAYNGDVDAIRLDNELVRVTGASALPCFVIEFWDGTAWRAKAVDVWRDSTALVFQKASILENRPEVCVVQYEATVAAGGRVTVDCTLRRGMRSALFQVNSNAVVLLSVSPSPLEAMTKTSEREISNAADAQGHKLVMGSARTWTQIAGTGLITRSATRSFDFFVALQLAGAVSGDTALDLSMQSLAGPWERVRAQRR